MIDSFAHMKMNNWIRKLSFRHRHHCGGFKKSPTYNLPLPVLLDIIDHMNFFEQLRMARLCRDVHSHIDSKLKKITSLDIRKHDIDQAMSTHQGEWHRHHREYVAVRFEATTAFIVIDEQWTNRDLDTLLSLMHVFHEWVDTVHMDAPIAELLVVSLSDVAVNRWYTFQCIMKLLDNFDDDDYHFDGGSLVSNRPTYWPRVRELTIRTKASQCNHLARVLDYGVKSAYVVDRRTLDKLRIVFSDIDAMNKMIKKRIYYFRCWAGSAGWDHRYETQFLGSSTSTSNDISV